MYEAHILLWKRHQAMEDMRALEAIRKGLNHEWLAKMKIVDARRREMLKQSCPHCHVQEGFFHDRSCVVSKPFSAPRAVIVGDPDG